VLAQVLQFWGRCAQFSQMKADSEIRWAVLNLVTLLRRHTRVHSRLVDAMSAGRSVGECIGVIEVALAGASEV
jgi:hypothetical protein